MYVHQIAVPHFSLFGTAYTRITVYIYLHPPGMKKGLKARLPLPVCGLRLTLCPSQIARIVASGIVYKNKAFLRHAQVCDSQIVGHNLGPQQRIAAAP